MTSGLEEVQKVFDAALQLAAPERAAFVRDQCAGDGLLERKVLRLLVASEDAPAVISSIVNPITDPGDWRIGAYRLIEMLSEGHMGVVWRAERADDQYQQTVAIKLLPALSTTRHLLERFSGEKQILGQLQHPNIARLLDAGVSRDGTPYFVMEYIKGHDIATFCNHNKLTIDERLRLFTVMLEAVRYAHSRLIVHRDLKPANILIDDSGDVKLLDFGVATMLNEEEISSPPHQHTHGHRAFTPAYAAPEQWLGQRCTVATDVYALGILLCEILCGVSPLKPSDLEARHLDASYEPRIMAMTEAIDDEAKRDADAAAYIAKARSTTLSRLRRPLSGDLQIIAFKALATEPAQRYQTAEAMLNDIERFQTGHVIKARPPTMGYRIARWAQRNMAFITISTTYILLSTIIMVLAVVSAVRNDRQKLALENAHDSAVQVADVLVSVFESADPDSPNASDVLAKDALQNGYVRVLSELSEQPLVQARVLGLVGEIYKKLGLHQEAERSLRAASRALDEADEQGMNELFAAASRAEIGRRLGDAVRGQGRYAEAEILLRNAWTDSQALYGPIDARSLDALNGLAENYFHAQLFEEGERLAREAVSIADQLGEEAFRERAMAYNNLAAVIYLTISASAAADALMKARALMMGGLFDGHPDVNRISANLAAALVSSKRLDEARQIYEGVVASHSTSGYPPNRSSAQAYYGLGLIFLNEGDAAKAEQHFQESIAINLRYKPETDYELILQRFMLAIALAPSGYSPAGDDLLNILLDQSRAHLATHSITGRILGRIAGQQLESGDRGRAEETLVEAETLFDALGNARPHHTAFSLAVRGRLHALDGEKGPATLNLAEAVRVLTERYGEHSAICEQAILWLRELDAS